MLQQNRPRDPHRPIYHFSPPQGVWGGGPDGTIHHAGLYHVFYQYNPYLYTPAGNTHWGHAVSPDLIHWEPRPIALAPSAVDADLYRSLAESDLARTLDRTGMPTIVNDRACCYSGSAVVNDGVPTIVYTRYIHGLADEPVMRGRAQCIATSDDAMLTWTKRPDPVIAAPPAELVPRALRDQPTRWMVRGRSDDHLKPGDLTAWHDPHVWRGDDAWYLALGCGFMGVGGALLLYRSDDLLDWEYLHPLCAGAEPEFNRWLVPDFFPLDGRHVLLAVATTRGRASKKIYQTGRYRDRRFQTGHEGFTDADTRASGPFSCARTLTAPDGRRILFGVINEQRPFRANPFGWASVLSLPRVLAVDGGGSLRMEPAREMCESRAPDWERLDADLDAGGVLDVHLRGDALEIVAEIEPRAATVVGLRLRQSPDGSEQTTLRYDAAMDRLTIDLTEASLDPAPARGAIGTTAHLPPGEPIRLHIFLDRSVIEVFCAGRSCLTARVYPTRPDSTGVQAFADGGRAALRRLAVWRKRSIGLYC